MLCNINITILCLFLQRNKILFKTKDKIENFLFMFFFKINFCQILILKFKINFFSNIFTLKSLEII